MTSVPHRAPRAEGLEGAGAPTETSGGAWCVSHLYYHVRTGEAQDAHVAKELVAALEEFATAADHQVLACTLLGLKADLGIMAIGPDGARHDQLVRALGRGVLGSALLPAFSFVSLTETSEYMETEEQVRTRLEQEHHGEDLERHLSAARARLEAYRRDKLHPVLPQREWLCFYPMSKARDPGANWYELDFAERRRLMSGHATVGRRHTGRVLQLITGATGLDDHEWGVTLVSDDLQAVKDVVYDMRFDPITARYARFGTFLVGRSCTVAELPARLGLDQ